MLFSDTNVKCSFRKLFERRTDACTIGHRRGQRHYLLVLFHQLAKRIPENLSIRGRFSSTLDRLAGREIKGTSSVPTVVVRFRLGEAFTLRSQGMDYHWTIFDLFCFS